MLGPYRVLDLATEGCQFCGKLAADLGADVIKIEPPGGDNASNPGPFYHNIPHSEKSLFRFAFNTGKRGITLNIQTVQGQELFRRLVKKADFIIESFPPGYMESLGLGYSDLSQINPGLIMTSITPFGQTGPYKDLKGPDIVTMAMGGYMFVTGEPKGPPLRVSFPQSAIYGSVVALAASLAALHFRKASGQGQHVDLSLQHTILWTLLNVRPWWQTAGVNQVRNGVKRGGRKKGAAFTLSWPCKDGAVSFLLLGGVTGPPMNQALVDWMDSEGMAGDLKGMDWKQLNLYGLDQEGWNKIEGPIRAFFMSHTKAELYEGALKRGIALTPESTTKDIVESVQLQDRGFWETVEHDELGIGLTYPGAFVKASLTPCRKPRRAPLIGEHNKDVYAGELGLSEKQLVTLKETGAI